MVYKAFWARRILFLDENQLFKNNGLRILVHGVDPAFASHGKAGISDAIRVLHHGPRHAGLQVCDGPAQVGPDRGLLSQNA